jgi:hypothetical protein
MFGKNEARGQKVALEQADYYLKNNEFENGNSLV